MPEVRAENLQTVAYFGQPGSYTQVAMKRYFKDEVNGQASASFEAVAEAVVSGKCRYGGAADRKFFDGFHSCGV